ncbi:MAG: GNAT family N-acetyltransferase [Desulforhopalus sp.]|jgi:ElaA protein|nr:GNAT family N-acetyltransferase [Desulforhopalus sp.]
MKIEWKLSPFKELSTEELYAILKLRQQVFVVEQQCVYLDCDGKDKRAYHLAGWHDRGEPPEPIAYMRIMYPEKGNKLTSIGRVLTHPNFRGKGFGREIMARCLLDIEKYYPESPVCISAQQYLTHFYESFGFRVSSDSYEEDGIPHIGMTRNPLA